MNDYGTYGSGLGVRSGGGGDTLLGLGATQKRQGMDLLAQSAEEEARRNQANQQVETQRKSGNSQLGSTVAGAAAGAAFGPWGALIGGAVGAIAGYQL